VKWSRTIFPSILTLSIIFSGCNVADKINENILDIEKDPLDNTQNKSDNNLTGNNGTIVVDKNNSTTIIDKNNSNNGNNSGTNDTNQTPQCQTGYHISGEQCVQDINNSTPVIEVNEFNLTFPEYNNAKSIDIVMAKNSTKNIVIRSNPKQTVTTTKLQYQQYTTNRAVIPTLIFGGAPIVSENFDYRFKIDSNVTIGKDEFRLFLENDKGFTDSVYVNVQVVDQIQLSGVRTNYSLVTGGDEQNITITAYNTLGNPLEFEIIDQSMINDAGKISLVINGSKIFSSNTKNGVDFKFSARGLKEETQYVEIKVKDKTTGTTKSINIYIESIKRNTEFYVDLYECNENLSKVYEVTTDTNTPLSPDGVYSSDNSIYLKSTHEMNYDIGNKFSTVMLFHPTNGQQYSYKTYGKEYVVNTNSGDRVAVIYFAKHLQGVRYYIKYYDEDKNSVICEKRNFPNIDTIEGETIQSLEDQYTTPDIQINSSSNGTGSIPQIF
jgi:hypothetical protein